MAPTELPLLASVDSKHRRAPGPGEIEAWARGRGLHTLVGADEVGRGPLAGPVVAAAVVLPEKHGLKGLDDSKRLSDGARRQLAREIRAVARGAAVVEISAQEIDRTNILRAALEAMAVAVRRALAGLPAGERPQLVLVDGNQPLPLQLPQRTIVGGDGRSEHIAAASILAKVYRDDVMTTLHLRWPAYAFDRNKGYGTAVHRAALRERGPCPIHRRSFRGVLPTAEETFR